MLDDLIRLVYLQRMDVDKVSLEGKDRVAAILENGRCL